MWLGYENLHFSIYCENIFYVDFINLKFMSNFLSMSFPTVDIFFHYKTINTNTFWYSILYWIPERSRAIPEYKHEKAYSLLSACALWYQKIYIHFWYSSLFRKGLYKYFMMLFDMDGWILNYKALDWGYLSFIYYLEIENNLIYWYLFLEFDYFNIYCEYKMLNKINKLFINWNKSFIFYFIYLFFLQMKNLCYIYIYFLFFKYLLFIFILFFIEKIKYYYLNWTGFKRIYFILINFRYYNIIKSFVNYFYKNDLLVMYIIFRDSNISNKNIKYVLQFFLKNYLFLLFFILFHEITRLFHFLYLIIFYIINYLLSFIITILLKCVILPLKNKRDYDSDMKDYIKLWGLKYFSNYWYDYIKLDFIVTHSIKKAIDGSNFYFFSKKKDVSYYKLRKYVINMWYLLKNVYNSHTFNIFFLKSYNNINEYIKKEKEHLYFFRANTEYLKINLINYFYINLIFKYFNIFLMSFYLFFFFFKLLIFLKFIIKKNYLIYLYINYYFFLIMNYIDFIFKIKKIINIIVKFFILVWKKNYLFFIWFSFILKKLYLFYFRFILKIIFFNFFAKLFIFFFICIFCYLEYYSNFFFLKFIIINLLFFIDWFIYNFLNFDWNIFSNIIYIYKSDKIVLNFYFLDKFNYYFFDKWELSYVSFNDYRIKSKHLSKNVKRYQDLGLKLITQPIRSIYYFRLKDWRWRGTIFRYMVCYAWYKFVNIKLQLFFKNNIYCVFLIVKSIFYSIFQCFFYFPFIYFFFKYKIIKILIVYIYAYIYKFFYLLFGLNMYILYKIYAIFIIGGIWETLFLFLKNNLKFLNINFFYLCFYYFYLLILDINIILEQVIFIIYKKVEFIINNLLFQINYFFFNLNKIFVEIIQWIKFFYFNMLNVNVFYAHPLFWSRYLKRKFFFDRVKTRFKNFYKYDNILLLTFYNDMNKFKYEANMYINEIWNNKFIFISIIEYSLIYFIIVSYILIMSTKLRFFFKDRKWDTYNIFFYWQQLNHKNIDKLSIHDHNYLRMTKWIENMDELKKDQEEKKKKFEQRWKDFLYEKRTGKKRKPKETKEIFEKILKNLVVDWTPFWTYYNYIKYYNFRYEQYKVIVRELFKKPYIRGQREIYHFLNKYWEFEQDYKSFKNKDEILWMLGIIKEKREWVTINLKFLDKIYSLRSYMFIFNNKQFEYLVNGYKTVLSNNKISIMDLIFLNQNMEDKLYEFAARPWLLQHNNFLNRLGMSYLKTVFNLREPKIKFNFMDILNYNNNLNWFVEKGNSWTNFLIDINAVNWSRYYMKLETIVDYSYVQEEIDRNYFDSLLFMDEIQDFSEGYEQFKANILYNRLEQAYTTEEGKHYLSLTEDTTIQTINSAMIFICFFFYFFVLIWFFKNITKRKPYNERLFYAIYIHFIFSVIKYFNLKLFLSLITIRIFYFNSYISLSKKYWHGSITSMHEFIYFKNFKLADWKYFWMSYFIFYNKYNNVQLTWKLILLPTFLEINLIFIFYWLLLFIFLQLINDLFNKK